MTSKHTLRSWCDRGRTRLLGDGPVPIDAVAEHPVHRALGHEDTEEEPQSVSRRASSPDQLGRDSGCPGCHLVAKDGAHGAVAGSVFNDRKARKMETAARAIAASESREEYSLAKILSIWALAAVPMAAVSWIVFPAVSPDPRSNLLGAGVTRLMLLSTGGLHIDLRRWAAAVRTARCSKCRCRRSVVPCARQFIHR